MTVGVTLRAVDKMNVDPSGECDETLINGVPRRLAGKDTLKTKLKVDHLLNTLLTPLVNR
jgi:hypothetical protein